MDIVTIKHELEKLQQEVDSLLEQEQAPAWLKELIALSAAYFGVTPEEVEKRMQVIHPTVDDPVLFIDGKPVISWV